MYCFWHVTSACEITGTLTVKFSVKENLSESGSMCSILMFEEFSSVMRLTKCEVG